MSASNYLDAINTPNLVTMNLSQVPTLKVRSSCDHCGTAKVKCDRLRPECGRCTTLSLACVYGLSQKCGKPSRKRPGSTFGKPAQKRNCIPRVVTVNNRHAINPVVNQPGELETSGLMENNTQFFSENNDQSQLTSGSYPSLPFEDWLQFDNFGGEIAPTSGLDSVSILGKNTTNTESHNCPRESYEIFRDLICPAPYLHAPESNSVTVSAQLDEVLHFSRDAMKRLTRVLKCPCAKSGHRAMVHASIVSRILIWYQQAAGGTGSSSWGPRPSSPAKSVTSSSSQPPSDTGEISPPSLVKATGFAVEEVPVLIGNFNIENENMQAVIRNQLVLCELKKTAELIDLFPSQDSGESIAASCVSGLYSSLAIWLRSEHLRTVEILKSRLTALNENIVS